MNALALALIIGTQEPNLKAQEASLLATLDQHFWDAKHQRWREMVGSDDEVFLWGYSVLLSTFANGAKVDPATYKPRLEQAFNGLAKYWTTKAPGAYAVSPGQNSKNPDRYYDDNAWVGLAAMEAFDATKERKYLDIAKKVMTYLRSGEDAKLGGGIYWHENKKESKNACVNAPAAMLAFRLHRVTGDQTTLKEANRWLDWTSKLVDPNDGLVMDNMNIAGKVEQTKWSYNSACYYQASRLSFGSALHPTTGPPHAYRTEDIHNKILWASESRWVDYQRLLIKNPGMFGMHLLEVLIETKPNEVQKLVASIFEKCRNEQGLFGEYWDRKPLPGEKLKLMYTASLLRTALLCRTR